MTLKIRSIDGHGRSGEQIEVIDGIVTYVAVDSTIEPIG